MGAEVSLGIGQTNFTPQGEKNDSNQFNGIEAFIYLVFEVGEGTDTL